MKSINKITLKTDALVIREMNIGESDKLITLLTRKYGVVKAFASGAKKLNSKKFSATSALSFADFSLVKTNDTYKVIEASVITNFFNVGVDIETLSLMQYFCEISETLAPEEDNADEFLRLILNSLSYLAENKVSAILLKSVVELRAATITGYMPDLVACSECAAFDGDLIYFDLLSGDIICDKCITKPTSRICINRTLLSAMRHIVYSPLEKLFLFKIPDESEKILNKITEKYLISHCEHSFTSLEFYKKLF